MDDGLGPSDSTSWRTRLRGSAERERIVRRFLVAAFARKRIVRWKIALDQAVPRPCGRGYAPPSASPASYDVQGPRAPPPVLVRALADQSHHPAKPQIHAHLRLVVGLSLRRGRPKRRARAPVLPALGLADSTSWRTRLHSTSLRTRLLCTAWRRRVRGVLSAESRWWGGRGSWAWRVPRPCGRGYFARPGGRGYGDAFASSGAIFTVRGGFTASRAAGGARRRGRGGGRRRRRLGRGGRS